MIALKQILVATDFSEPSAAALAYGRELARNFNATLHVLHVVDDIGSRVATGAPIYFDIGQLQSEVESAARTQLNALLSDEDRKTLNARTVVLTSPSPANAITSYARDTKPSIDIIVMGTRGRGGVAHMLMGSVAERVVRTAPCPVLAVRHPEHEFVLPDALQHVEHA
jgi:nucleotide-binding universal stress UspA family protein